MYAKRNGWRGLILSPASLSLLLAGCASFLGPGGPKVPIWDLPAQPAYEETHAHELEWNESTVIYRAPEERGEEEELAAGFSETAWLRFQEWLREVLARFNANLCALKAVNGEDDDQCKAPSQ